MDYVNCPEHKIPQITNDKKTNKQNSQNKKKTIKKNNKMKKNTNLNQHFKITFKKKKIYWNIIFQKQPSCYYD